MCHWPNMVSTSSKCKIEKLAVWLADGLTYIIYHLLCMSAWTRNIKFNHGLFAPTQTRQTLYSDTQNYLHLHIFWCEPLMFACLQNGLNAIISHSKITITIFLHSSYTQILRIINLTMIYLHLHKQGRLWCQSLIFTCLQNGLYVIISHSNITITIFLHFSYTHILRIIHVTMIYLHLLHPGIWTKIIICFGTPNWSYELIT
jgi:hypothetical protein